MVAERKGVDRLNLRISTPEGVPLPSYLNEKGTRDYAPKVKKLLVFLGNGLSKPAGNVGQHVHHNAKRKAGQFHFLLIEWGEHKKSAKTDCK